MRRPEGRLVQLDGLLEHADDAVADRADERNADPLPSEAGGIAVRVSIARSWTVVLEKLRSGPASVTSQT